MYSISCIVRIIRLWQYSILKVIEQQTLSPTLCKAILWTNAHAIQIRSTKMILLIFYVFWSVSLRPLLKSSYRRDFSYHFPAQSNIMLFGEINQFFMAATNYFRSWDFSAHVLANVVALRICRIGSNSSSKNNNDYAITANHWQRNRMLWMATSRRTARRQPKRTNADPQYKSMWTD